MDTKEVQLEAVVDALKDLDTETVINEQALAALDAVDAIEEIDTTNVAPADDGSVEVDEEFLKDLDLSVAKAAAYGAQEVTPMPDIAETVSGATAAAAKTKKTKSTTKVAGAAPTPRATKELAAVPAEFFDLVADSGRDAAELEANKTAVMAKRPDQVKIAEKFDNLFTQLAAGRTPSTYVMQAFKLLDEKKTVSSADLIANYRAAGLGDGTARSQTGQIMVLLDVVGIATRTGKTLTLLANSKIAERIRALAAAPAPAATA